jgi:sugar/nucleoside kinase (ribokinase family)
MIGAVGDDEFGSQLIQGPQNDGINTDGVRVVHGEKMGVAVSK